MNSFIMILQAPIYRINLVDFGNIVRDSFLVTISYLVKTNNAEEIMSCPSQKGRMYNVHLFP